MPQREGGVRNAAIEIRTYLVVLYAFDEKACFPVLAFDPAPGVGVGAGL